MKVGVAAQAPHVLMKKLSFVRPHTKSAKDQVKQDLRPSALKPGDFFWPRRAQRVPTATTDRLVFLFSVRTLQINQGSIIISLATELCTCSEFFFHFGAIALYRC